MDFMSYAFEGSGLELAADMNERNLKSFSHNQIDQTVTRNPNHEGAQFMEFGLGDMLQKSPLCDPRVSSGDQIDNDFAEMVLSHHHHHHHPVTESWLPRDAISCHGWKTSSSFNLVSDINFESGLKVYDDRNKKAKSGEDSKENLDLSSSGEGAEASAKVKRARITNLGSQTPICQVHGCLKDLSSSKDYYRRHRVCNEHSKTTKVVVDGIEQRFCQQCSRFHLLSEFDDDKRSCRKSLAGHNERRRKPQFDTHHHGPRFFDMNLQTEQFFLPELLPVNYFCQERYELENNIISRSIKMDNDEKHISFSKLVPPKSSTLHAIQKRDQSKNNNNNNNFGKMVQELSTGEINSLSDNWGFGKIEESSDVYYEGEIDENFQCGQNGETIDLEQLSTHLQRVEQQRNSAQLKQESGNNLFYCFTSG